MSVRLSIILSIFKKEGQSGFKGACTPPLDPPIFPLLKIAVVRCTTNFFRGRTGFVQSISLKVGLSFMCAANLQDKYKCKSLRPKQFIYSMILWLSLEQLLGCVHQEIFCMTFRMTSQKLEIVLVQGRGGGCIYSMLHGISSGKQVLLLQWHPWWTWWDLVIFSMWYVLSNDKSHCVPTFSFIFIVFFRYF